MSLILLRSSNGARLLDRPRDLPGYEGRGASTALLLAIDRLRDRRGERALTLHLMAIQQVGREQRREMA